MPPSMSEIRQLEQTRYPVPTRIIYDQPPSTPTGLTVTGQQGLIRVQWSPVNNVEGYDVAVSTNGNLAAPDINIARVPGSKNREYVYSTGNVAITRYFAVRSFVGEVYSAWSAPVTGLSVVFGAAESAPPTPPATSPSGDEPIPAGRSYTGTGAKLAQL